jgi:hypothetical protein
MNDFAVDITDLVGVVNPRSFSLSDKKTEKGRSFKIVSGAGCLPTVGTQRKIKGYWITDKMPDTINSYDFEYVLGKDGKRIERTPEEQSDVEPVMLAGEIRETKTALVRRKK